MERFAACRNLQQLDLISCPVLRESVYTAISSLPDLQHLSLADINVSFYSILYSLSNLVHLRYLDLHKLRILSASEERTLSNDQVMTRVHETFSKMFRIQHLDISSMIHSVTDPKEFVSNVLAPLKDLEWLDVSDTPGLTLMWVLGQIRSLDKLQVLNFLDATDYVDVMAAGRLPLPTRLQIVCPAAGRVELLLQSQYLRHGNTALSNVLLNVTDTNWPDESFEIDTIRCVANFCRNGLTMMRGFVDYIPNLYVWLGHAYLSFVQMSNRKFYQVTEKIVESLLVSCFVNQKNIELQALLWEMVWYLLDYYCTGLETPTPRAWLYTGLGCFGIWNLEMAKNPEFVVNSGDAVVEMFPLCVKTVSLLLDTLDVHQCSHLGSDLGLVDTLVSLICGNESVWNIPFSSVKSDEFFLVIGMVKTLTEKSPMNCKRLLFLDGGLGGARILIDLGFRLIHDDQIINTQIINTQIINTILLILTNVIEHPQLRQHLCFGDLFRFYNIVLDMGGIENLLQIEASHAICELCLDEVLLGKLTDFGVGQLLTKMERVFTSVSFKKDSDDPNLENLCCLIEMVGCSYAPQVVLFGLWRIASCCSICPRYYCPMVFRDGAISAVRQLGLPEKPTDLKERFQEIIAFIETVSTGYEGALVPSNKYEKHC